MGVAPTSRKSTDAIRGVVSGAARAAVAAPAASCLSVGPMTGGGNGEGGGIAGWACVTAIPAGDRVLTAAASPGAAVSAISTSSAGAIISVATERGGCSGMTTGASVAASCS
jgi:hypothetical protein